MRYILEMFTGFLGVSAKGIRQKMVENRIKFDRDVIAHGDSDEEWDYDYDDWDPFLDLSDEELEARIRRFHARMDHNRDGFVDMEELLVWCLVSIYNIEGKDAVETWDVEISEAKETLSYDEVIEEIHDHVFQDPSGELEPEGLDVFNKNVEVYYDYNRMYNRDKARFTAADINGDGLMDKKEWVLFHNPLKDEAIQNAAIEEAMPYVDTNSDEKISFEEFVNDFREKPDKKMLDEKHNIMKSMFKLIDRDGSGFLENDELVLWLNPEHAELAEEEADHLMDMCDDVDDDDDEAQYDEKLTAEEIIAETELWVDSQVSEYGEQFRHMDELR